MVQKKQKGMTSRDKILLAIKTNQPERVPLPDVDFPQDRSNLVDKFTNMLVSIGGSVIAVSSLDEIYNNVIHSHPGRIVSTIPELADKFAQIGLTKTPHEFEDVQLAILPGEFAVAENGAVWLEEKHLGERVLPFITAHLILVVEAKNIVASMHEAYERIGETNYEFGTFIAGPSKTADIEQSLVLGAHGAKTLSVCLFV
jgi:L-lactate dehydrogenase complex protein LldG